MRAISVALWCCAVMLTGCVESGSSPDVVSATPGLANWSIGEEPLLVIGHEGNPDYEFTSIVGMGRLRSGGWFAFDRGANELRIFDARGKLSHKVGRTGSGPGEFRDVRIAMGMAGDSILVYDQGLQRLTIVQLERNNVQSWRAPSPPSGGFIQPAGILSGDELLWSELRLAACEPNTLAWDSLAYFRAPIGNLRSDGDPGDRSGALLPLGRWPSRLRWGDVTSGRCFSRVVPFAPVHLSYVHGERIYIAAGDRLEVRVIDLRGGRDILVVQAAVGRGPALTTERITEYIQSAVGSANVDETGRSIADVNGVAAYRRALENLPYPDSLPAIGQLVVDAHSYIWVRQDTPSAAEPSVWWVFTPNGDLKERFALPARLKGNRFRVVEIGADYIAGVYRDSFDVQSIRAFSLRRGTTASGSTVR